MRVAPQRQAIELITNDGERVDSVWVVGELPDAYVWHGREFRRAQATSQYVEVEKDSMKAVTTVDGDMIDALVFRTTGRTATSLEVVLDANPHLRHQPEVMPIGVAVTIPDAALAMPVRPAFKLWE